MLAGSLADRGPAQPRRSRSSRRRPATSSARSSTTSGSGTRSPTSRSGPATSRAPVSSSTASGATTPTSPTSRCAARRCADHRAVPVRNRHTPAVRSARAPPAFPATHPGAAPASPVRVAAEGRLHARTATARTSDDLTSETEAHRTRSTSPSCAACARTRPRSASSSPGRRLASLSSAYPRPGRTRDVGAGHGLGTARLARGVSTPARSSSWWARCTGASSRPRPASAAKAEVEAAYIARRDPPAARDRRGVGPRTVASRSSAWSDAPRSRSRRAPPLRCDAGARAQGGPRHGEVRRRPAREAGPPTPERTCHEKRDRVTAETTELAPEALDRGRDPLRRRLRRRDAAHRGPLHRRERGLRQRPRNACRTSPPRSGRPAGTIAGVSSFQVHISDHEILTPGDMPNVLVAMNPAALKANIARARARRHAARQLRRVRDPRPRRRSGTRPTRSRTVRSPRTASSRSR